MKKLYYFTLLTLPFLYVESQYLMILMFIVSLFFLKCLIKETDMFFVIAFLLSNLYSSIDIFGFKLYDVISILMFIYVLMTRKISFKKITLLKIILFVFVIFTILLLRIDDYAFIELIRYLISIMLFVSVIGIHLNLNAYKNYIYGIIFIAIYNALLIYLFQSNGYLLINDNGLISTNIYIYKDEIRLGGFFSDPNKYMAFCCFYFIVLYISYGGKLNKKMIFIVFASLLLSLSRTSLLIVGTYLMFELGNYIYKKSKPLFILIMLIIPIIVLFILKYDIINEIFVISAKLLGRERTLTINTNISEDNRMLIWKTAIDIFNKNPLLGYGLSANTILLAYPSHNTILSMVLDGGIIFLLSYLLFISDILKIKVGLLVPFIFIPLFFLDLGNFRMLFFLLAILNKERIEKSEFNHYNKKIWK